MQREADDEILRRAGLEPPSDRAQGLFRAGGWLRRVSGEPAVLLGGGRALLLEVAHPLVAAGVHDHSDFRSDPFGRLRRTLDALGAVTFGPCDEALAALRGIEASHRRVRGQLSRAAGVLPAGTPYSGRDPELVRWVWATLMDTSREVYERFVGPLGTEAREECYADQRVLGRLLGVPDADLPAHQREFAAWFEAQLTGATLHVTPEARAIAQAVLDAPVPGRGLLRRITTELLPEHLRAAFGLALEPKDSAKVAALAERVRALRAAGPALDADGEAR